ncbi:5-oxoprolinase-like, partial [Rhincodon typus]|uniref:5-oxoprolinase-like n=1 Tax=Rhincodon typus TaxID=259920 RepID=UPI00202F5B83
MKMFYQYIKRAKERDVVDIVVPEEHCEILNKIIITRQEVFEELGSLKVDKFPKVLKEELYKELEAKQCAYDSVYTMMEQFLSDCGDSKRSKTEHSFHTLHHKWNTVHLKMQERKGCLAPVKIIIPKGSILDPSVDAAVVGGNVLTSQRVVDVIFKAFEVCAASQGCMNNITFGNERVGYYETVAGGSGAGPHWDGRGGVHTHMTNTRITDPEILEKRYPVILKRFELNRGSGGKGRHPGGDGVIRELLFRERVVLSVLTERRAFCPYGLN